MTYLAQEKLEFHLKLKRSIYQFIRVGQFFESKTFEYVELTKASNLYTVKYIQVLDYLYSSPTSIDEFETTDLIEGNETIFTGELEACLNWSTEQYKCLPHRWKRTIVDIYTHHVDTGVLGQS